MTGSNGQRSLSNSMCFYKNVKKNFKHHNNKKGGYIHTEW